MLPYGAGTKTERFPDEIDEGGARCNLREVLEMESESALVLELESAKQFRLAALKPVHLRAAFPASESAFLFLPVCFPLSIV